MKNIILVCAAGMSTSILVKKMKEAVDPAGEEIKISAMPMGELRNVSDKIDCILIGPQVSYMEDEIRASYEGIPVAVINSIDYGMLEGKKVMKVALKLMAK